MIRSAKCHLANSTFKWDKMSTKALNEVAVGVSPVGGGGGGEGRFLSAGQVVTCDASTFPEKE